MGSFNRKSEFRKAENIDKPISSNETFKFTSGPHMSLLPEFCGNNYAHVILTAEVGSLPTDAGSCIVAVAQWDAICQLTPELIHQVMFDFYGNQMLKTEMDMPQ